MKILFNCNCCKVVFEANEKYSGQTLLIEGEGNLEREFFVYKSHIHQMCWTKPTEFGDNRFVLVDEYLRNDVLSYVMEEAKKYDLSLVLW